MARTAPPAAIPIAAARGKDSAVVASDGRGEVDAVGEGGNTGDDEVAVAEDASREVVEGVVVEIFAEEVTIKIDDDGTGGDEDEDVGGKVVEDGVGIAVGECTKPDMFTVVNK